MITQATLDGKPALIAFLAPEPKGGFRPVERTAAETVKVIWDHRIAFFTPKEFEARYGSLLS